MTEIRKLGLFAGYGVEMEYMIVDRDTLEVKPIADEVLKAEAGNLTSDVERGEMSWSNELVLHVLELKTNGPAPELSSLVQKFHVEVMRVNELLAPFHAILLPTGAHPFMNPDTQTKLWPHESSEIYEAYNKIFNCQGHGWSNLQSTHLNLPFSTDEEFGRLHAAIRLVLPLIPALSAASPLLDGKISGLQDTRLEVYRTNQQKLPLNTGEVVPEAVFTQAAYNTQIFQPMFKAIAPLDPENVLQEEFLNSRGAIARFSRGAIEIRIIDNQECPLADIAIVALVTQVLKHLVAEEWSTYEQQQHAETHELAAVFRECLQNGFKTQIKNTAYLQLFGIEQGQASLQTVWEHLWQEVKEQPGLTYDKIYQSLEHILKNGNLSQRILSVLGDEPSLDEIKAVYHQLAICLAQNKMFVP